jgi:hypothetical protein
LTICIYPDIKEPLDGFERGKLKEIVYIDELAWKRE